MDTSWDVFVIGRGPAGVSAAIYTQRAGFKTAAIGRDSGAAATAKHIENYYGFEQPISGVQLTAAGDAQLRRLGAEALSGEVFSLQMAEGGGFALSTSLGAMTARAVVLAAGRSRVKAAGLNLGEYDGRGVSYCAVCDGFFHRGKPVCVLGAGDYAASECAELLPIVSGVTLLTNGAPLTARSLPAGVTVDERPIARLSGGDALARVEFKSGDPVETSALFVALGSASATDIARSTGLMLRGGAVDAAADMSTNVPGIFAAGDCTGGVAQVAVAVGQGAMAGLSAAAYLRG